MRVRVRVRVRARARVRVRVRARECCGTGARLVSSGDGPLQKRDAAAMARPDSSSGTSPSRSAMGPETTETMAYLVGGRW